MSAEGMRQSWPDLDVSYFRWEPPVFPGVSAGCSDGGKKVGSSSHVESAFAHSSYPLTFAGWDKVRAASEAEETEKATQAIAGQQRSEQRSTEQRGFAPASGARVQGVQGMNGIPDFQLPATAAYQGQSRPNSRQQGSPSALVRPRAAENHTPAPMVANARNFSWPTQRQHQHKQQPYGASFEGLFSEQQPSDSQSGAAARVGSGAMTGAQPSDPVLLVQCGHFTAPVQRETALQQPGTQQPAQPASWPSLYASSGPSSGLRPSKAPPLQRAPSGDNPLQLQEYYAAQSDLLDELIKGRGVNNPQILAALQGMQEGDLDPEFLEMLGPGHMGRASSALEVPVMQVASSGSQEMEPYMPQWQSESVPAELPNHVVTRLMMGPSTSSQPPRGHSANLHNRSLSGSKRDWSGLPAMPSIPDDKDLPSPGRRRSLGSLLAGRMDAERSLSPKVEELDELARTADVEVAHRAFLVPAHKKRGKGGRQPAADPRLDPSIDTRRAKRILANRLSAARSKMKQKNQMDSLATVVAALEEHRKHLQADSAGLMEVCETMGTENRRLQQQARVLEEFIRRQTLQHNRLLLQPTRNSLQEGTHNGHVLGEGIKAEPTINDDLFPSKPSDESLLRTYQTGNILVGEALLEFARE